MTATAKEAWRERLHRTLPRVAEQLLHDARLVEIDAGGVAPESALDLMRAMKGDIEKALARVSAEGKMKSATCRTARRRRDLEELASRCITRLRHGCMLADYSLQGAEPEDAVAYLAAALRVVVPLMAPVRTAPVSDKDPAPRRAKLRRVA